MKESYVSYECAKRLKECGFDWECDKQHSEIIPDTGRLEWDEEENRNLFIEDIEYTQIPSLSLAQKWLREVKEIDVLVFNCACGYGWEISKADPQSRGTTIALFDDNGEDEASGMWLSYESALSAGIDAALNLLTEKK